MKLKIINDDYVITYSNRKTLYNRIGFYVFYKETNLLITISR